MQMELWQIGDSPFAPKFQIKSQPNDWAKAVKSGTTKSELSETKLLQLNFWDDYDKNLLRNKIPIARLVFR